MKSYPHIPNCRGQKFQAIPNAYIFDKLDGNNLRFEYSNKQGWHKFGSRTQLIDETNEQFSGAIPYFLENLAENINRLNPKAKHIIAFCEWVGPNSFIGMHSPGDVLELFMFDICVDKKGFTPPKDFVKTYVDKIQTPKFLGINNFTRGLIQEVEENRFPGITYEGIVAKSVKGNQLIMGKAKTGAWRESVKSTFHDNGAAEKILNS